MDLKRDEIKYVRDLAKSSYQKDKECFICGTTEELQFHHFYSMTLLWNKWKKNNDIKIQSVDDVLVERENFKGVHYKEIYADTVTLCKFHHTWDALHICKVLLSLNFYRIKLFSYNNQHTSKIKIQ